MKRLFLILVIFFFFTAVASIGNDERTARTFAEQRWIRTGSVGYGQELRFDRIEMEKELSEFFLGGSGKIFKVTFGNPSAALAGRSQFYFTVVVEDGTPQGLEFEEEALNFLAKHKIPVSTQDQAESLVMRFSRLLNLKPARRFRSDKTWKENNVWKIRKTFIVDPFQGGMVTYDCEISPDGTFRISNLRKLGF